MQSAQNKAIWEWLTQQLGHQRTTSPQTLGGEEETRQLCSTNDRHPLCVTFDRGHYLPLHHSPFVPTAIALCQSLRYDPLKPTVAPGCTFQRTPGWTATGGKKHKQERRTRSLPAQPTVFACPMLIIAATSPFATLQQHKTAQRQPPYLATNTPERETIWKG